MRQNRNFRLVTTLYNSKQMYCQTALSAGVQLMIVALVVCSGITHDANNIDEDDDDDDDCNPSRITNICRISMEKHSFKYIFLPNMILIFAVFSVALGCVSMCQSDNHRRWKKKLYF